MNLLNPNLSSAPGAKLVVNSLYDSTEPGFLTQDLLLVELPSHAHIDVSWIPEHDPSGAYYVTVFRGNDQLAEVKTKTAVGALTSVESLAKQFTEQSGRASHSGGETLDLESRPLTVEPS